MVYRIFRRPLLLVVKIIIAYAAGWVFYHHESWAAEITPSELNSLTIIKSRSE